MAIVLTRPSGHTGGTVSLSALRVEQDLAFYHEYIRQRRRPRKYSLSRSISSAVLTAG